MKAVAAALGLALLASPSVGRAEEPSAAAAEFFRVGTQAFERADFRAAALAFEEADRRAPRAITVYNAGLAWDGAGDKPRAADGYRDALGRGGLPATQAAHAKERLAILEKEVGTIRVKAPPGATISVAHVVRRAPPLLVHLLPGTAEVRVEEAGVTARSKTVAVVAGADVTVAFDAIAKPLSPAPPPRVVVRDAGVSRGWAWASLGAAAVATGAGIGFGLKGVSANDAYNAGGNHSAGLRDDAITFRTAADVAFGGAILLGAAGVVLLVVSRPSRPAAPTTASAFAPRLGP